MTAIYEQYEDEMRREFGYLAVWLPNVRVSLGDVGILRRDRFEPVTSLASLGVRADAREPGKLTDLQFASAGQVDVSWGGGTGCGTVPVAHVGATVTVSFRRAYATFFDALGCRIQSIADLRSLEAQLRELAGRGLWQRDFTVVTELVTTGSATVLISNQSGARIDFKVSAEAMVQPLSLARAATGLSMMSASGLAVRVIAPDGLTPLFRACGLRSQLRKPPRLTFRGDEPEAAGLAGELGSQADLVELSYEDVAVS